MEQISEKRAKLFLCLEPKSKTERDGKSRLSSPVDSWVYATTPNSELADGPAVCFPVHLITCECASCSFDGK